MAPNGDDQDHYQPHDAVAASFKGAMHIGGAGLFVAAIQNVLTVQKLSAWSIFTRSGGMIATFGAIGATYEFSRHASANLRQKDDSYNHAIGGFLAGSLIGLRTGRMPPILGWGTVTAVILSAYDYTGGTLRGARRDPEVDEYERKEKLRLNRRRPVEETLAEVGEGRSIRPPGYEERRRQRLKEKYGVDIQTVSADPNAA
ncbi:hypothetical protein B0T17DRAFT_492354 [Bombardia bombarda]|uniref:NADH-ubiquinone oxidoreductase 21.3 kDa subunit n=1 Tax=Bombardia bombarda TaxID=252184 RepID=A0AA39X144_9PEZI|nr:hypothetical protein B0T17DRAFT_492354 [Bombardia bombarda]